MLTTAATRRDQESKDDASVDKAALCASYQIQRGTQFGSPWKRRIWVPAGGVGASRLPYVPGTMPKTMSRVSKPE